MKLFVPIKANSQRVPNKNFRMLGDMPLYKYVLSKFGAFNIYVDTDSTELMDKILDDTDLRHVSPFLRSPALVGDEVPVSELIVNFIQRFGIKGTVGQIHVTSPFLRAETFEDALDRFHESEHDSIIACNVLHTRLWRKESYGYAPVNHNPMKLEQTQDLPALYEENSAFYIFNANDYLDTGNRVGKNPLFYPVGYPENVDIDTEDDWELCCAIYNSLNT